MYLAPQSGQLLAFGGGEAAALAAVDVGALHPLTDRGLGEIEVAADLSDALPGRAHQGDDLGLVLVSELSTFPSSHLDLLCGVFPTSWWSALSGHAQAPAFRVDRDRRHIIVTGSLSRCVEFPDTAAITLML
jgi:hypothetical protein